MTIRTVGVLGFGLMGSGIAQVCAAAGYRTIVREVADDVIDRSRARLRKSVADAVAKGRLPQEASEKIEENLSTTTQWDALAPCDAVIEAIVEDAGQKKTAYAALEPVLAPDALLLSNTSSLSVTALAALTSRPDRFAGLHFFNPVPAMKLVEIVRGIATTDATFTAVQAFARALGKDPVTAPDRSGFIVNRLLIPYLLDAMREYEAGHGSREDIDTAMKLGCGHPMGPLTLADFIGLDTTLAIADIMFEEFREPRFAPPPLLKRMVVSGALGRKSGQGFYSYAPQK